VNKLNCNKCNVINPVCVVDTECGKVYTSATQCPRCGRSLEDKTADTPYNPDLPVNKDINLFLTGEIPRSKLFEKLRKLNAATADLVSQVKTLQTLADEAKREVSRVNKLNAQQQNKIIRLEALVEKLKSCENCVNWKSEDRGGCDKWSKSCSGYPKFEQWKHDQ